MTQTPEKSAEVLKAEKALEQAKARLIEAKKKESAVDCQVKLTHFFT